jgi:SNF2 family DNA or RNA helicase
MVMKNSIEERMMKVQKAKSTLGKGTLTKLTKEEEKIAKLTGMKDLFEIDDVRSHGKTSISDDWLDH